MNVGKYLKQTAVYWSCSGTDGFGKPTHGIPVDVSCRWNYLAKEFIAADGTKTVSSCVVTVNQDLDIGGVLLLGELDSNVDQDHPMENEGAYEIQQVKKTPNRKATKFAQEVYL